MAGAEDRDGMQLAEEQGGNRSGLLVKQEEVPGYVVECDAVDYGVL